MSATNPATDAAAELSKRHQWIQQKLMSTFNVDDETSLRCLVTNRKKIDAFLSDVKSPPKLFFFLQQRANSKPEILLSIGGDGDKLEGKCFYLLRDSNRAINIRNYQDTTVLCGEVTADILQTFESTLSQVFHPLLQRQDEWGLIKQQTTKQAFLEHMSKYDADLNRKIQNLSGDVELRNPSSKYDNIEQKPAAYAKAAKDSAILEHFTEIVTSWCDVITKYLEDDRSNIPLDKDDNSGPDVEIEYWSRRLLTLISITEQLKTKPNRVVTGVLKARALKAEGEDSSTAVVVSKQSSHDDAHGHSEQETIRVLLERWREVDLTITDALNEAKDNVRYLENLRRVIEPLYIEAPAAICDTMPSLMNSMKMIHTLSRHYGSEIRMSNLFVRITNQLITRCKEDIYNGGNVAQLWQQDTDTIIQKMQASIRLCEEYRAQYKDTKNKLAQMPKGKQFTFDETAIFGKFTRFRRRLEKLIDMFSSVSQFRALERKHIDGMEELISTFDHLIADFRSKGHDLLDYNNTTFERDYVEFTMHNSGLENAIQDFTERSLLQMSSIDKQLELMRKFADVIVREALQEDLDRKYMSIFRRYGEDLHNIQQLYEKHKDNPPIPRNMTRIAGNIHWSRQLLRRITNPIRQFQQQPRVFHSKDSKKIVKHYNRLARTLIEFETLWFQAWVKSCDTAKKGLRAKLLVDDPQTGKLVVNFDHGVLTLIREAKHLQLMGFDLPNSARVVLLLEDKLKSYYNETSFVLSWYHRVISQVPPVVRSLMKSHLADLENALKPAQNTMTWTSMNIESFLQSVHDILARFEYLVLQVNDIISNRIQKNLDLITNMQLLNLPRDRSLAVRDFAGIQRQHIDQCSEVLHRKNEEIERAVDDLIESVLSYPLDPMLPKPASHESNFLKLHYCHLLYHSLLSAVKNNLNTLKRRMSAQSGEGNRKMITAAGGNAGGDGAANGGSSSASGNSQGGSNAVAAAESQQASLFTAGSTVPLFEVDLVLQIPSVSLSPSIDELLEAISAVVRDLLQYTGRVKDWGIDPTATTFRRAAGRRPFSDKLTQDKNLAVTLLLLTGAVETTRQRAEQHVVQYSSFSWLWNQDPQVAYVQFVKEKSPILEDFLQELHRFVDVESDINELASYHDLGSLLLKIEGLKQAFKHEVERWKLQYSEKLHQEAKADMDSLLDLMNDLKNKLEREVKDMASLKFVMDTQSEIRDVQSWIDAKFDSIIERYNALEKYLPFGGLSKEEMDSKSILRPQWSQILKMSKNVMGTVNSLQGGFKQTLIEDVKVFKVAVKSFRSDYDINGPMLTGIAPSEAITRLNKYKREYETLKRKYELYNGGEQLFGLPEQQYPDLVKTGKELRLLDQLYTLYQGVISTVDEYKGIPWSSVVANIQQMNEKVENLNQQCRRLPKALKTWDAYTELSKTIEEFLEVLPLLTELSKDAMRDRHWLKISKLTGKEFDVNKFHEMKLRSVLEANLLQFREDIEEITDSAEKQLSIERKLAEIQALWEKKCFEFSVWKDRGDVILSGSAVNEVIEQLEESQGSLIQMLTQRHVTPFKDTANSWLKKLSDVNDTLEQWIKVQMLWMSLEAVFTGGDISRQMPQDTRVFMKVDKEWTTRLMNKAMLN